MSFLDRILGRRGDESDREPGPDPVAEAPLRDEEYRAADPRDLVEDDGTLMAGPGGTPQDSGPAEHPDAAKLEEPEEQE